MIKMSEKATNYRTLMYVFPYIQMNCNLKYACLKKYISAFKESWVIPELSFMINCIEEKKYELVLLIDKFIVFIFQLISGLFIPEQVWNAVIMNLGCFYHFCETFP